MQDTFFDQCWQTTFATHRDCKVQKSIALMSVYRERCPSNTQLMQSKDTLFLLRFCFHQRSVVRRDLNNTPGLFSIGNQRFGGNLKSQFDNLKNF